LDKIKVTVRYDGPIEAPIALGQPIAELIVERPGLPAVSTPLVAAAAVERGGLISRVTAALTTLTASDPAAPEPTE
jgi:D-alanyl-D-alanine carboxypeptidase (penicillin-binding protein 5/6)